MTTTRPRRIDSRRPWLPNVREFLGARNLLVLLGRRDITVRYRQTIMGIVWVFVGPIAASGLFSFVFGEVADLSSGDVPYFAFSYAGLLGWTVFSATLSGTANSLTSNSSLITKVYFPRLTLPFAALTNTLVNAGISLVVMGLLLVAFDIGFTARLLLLPAWVLLTLALALGLGLIAGSFAVTYRDVSHFIGVVMPLLMFVTPVVYATSEIPSGVRTWYLLNPMATLIEGFRWSLLGQGTVTMWALLYTVIMCGAVFFAGLVVFTRFEWRFADVI